MTRLHSITYLRRKGDVVEDVAVHVYEAKGEELLEEGVAGAAVEA
jgi:hypothetical protein